MVLYLIHFFSCCLHFCKYKEWVNAFDCNKLNLRNNLLKYEKLPFKYLKNKLKFKGNNGIHTDQIQ